MKKTCSRCKIEKPLDEFCKHKECENGVNSICKECVRVYGRNPEKFISKIKQANELFSLDLKKCSQCKKLKSVQDFGVKPSSFDGLRPQCKLCNNANAREYRANNREKFLKANKERHKKDGPMKTKNGKLKRYGITIEIYNKILESQNGVCKICNNPETYKNQKGNIRALSVDHDHKTGKVRGLLCSGCNNMLGHAKDSTERLQSGINYLNSNK